MNYEVEWLINGEVNQTDVFTSADVKDGEIESILPGESLESFERIEQVSGILMLLWIYSELWSILIILFHLLDNNLFMYLFLNIFELSPFVTDFI